MIASVNHIEPVARRIRAFLAGELVLDTTAAIYVWEWPNYPQYYIPLTDIRADLLVDEHPGHSFLPVVDIRIVAARRRRTRHARAEQDRRCPIHAGSSPPRGQDRGPRRMTIRRGFAPGLASGAAGTTALNVVTYLDMAVRGRPTSSTPKDTVERLAARAGIDIPGDGDTRQNRLAGLGPLTGLAAGLGVGAALGVARTLGFRPSTVVGGVLAGIAAMAGTDAPMAALGVTDPSTWAAKDWLSDAIPHLAYGLVAAAVLASLDPRTRLRIERANLRRL